MRYGNSVEGLERIFIFEDELGDSVIVEVLLGSHENRGQST